MSIHLDGVLIKKAHRQESYTHEQIQEFAACVDSKTGPMYFLNNFFTIQHPVKGQHNIVLMLTRKHY